MQQVRVGAYVMKQKLKGNKRYPLVLMLEPLFQCNLACAGCGKIDHPDEILKKRVSVEDALAAADECGAPVVSIPGGEPLEHPDFKRIVEWATARWKRVEIETSGVRRPPPLTVGIGVDVEDPAVVVHRRRVDLGDEQRHLRVHPQGRRVGHDRESASGQLRLELAGGGLGVVGLGQELQVRRGRRLALTDAGRSCWATPTRSSRWGASW